MPREKQKVLGIHISHLTSASPGKLLRNAESWAHLKGIDSESVFQTALVGGGVISLGTLITPGHYPSRSANLMVTKWLTASEHLARYLQDTNTNALHVYICPLRPMVLLTFGCPELLWT